MFLLLTFGIDVQQLSAAVLVLNLHRVANCAFLLWSLWTQGLCWNCTSGVWWVIASTLWFLFAADSCDQSPLLLPPALPAGVLLSPGAVFADINRSDLHGDVPGAHPTPRLESISFPQHRYSWGEYAARQIWFKWNQFLKPFRNGF